MTGAMTTRFQTLYDDWAKAVSTLVWCQWKLLDARYEVAAKLLDALTATPPAEEPPNARPAKRSGPTPACGAEEVARRAAECMRKGLPPPREIYEVQNRGRIDWSQFPEWARPSDPDLFEGCPHEG